MSLRCWFKKLKLHPSTRRAGDEWSLSVLGHPKMCGVMVPAGFDRGVELTGFANGKADPVLEWDAGQGALTRGNPYILSAMANLRRCHGRPI